LREPSTHSGLVFDIQHYALYDGPGIRSALYLKGCPLRCYWCHNPEAQRRAPEVFRWPDRLEEVGEAVTIDGIVARVLVDRPFFDRSGGGVTITGGEPTSQPGFLLHLLDKLRAQGVHTTLETCGYFPEPLVESLCALVDLFLFDIKHIDSRAHRSATGVGNERILDNFSAILQSVGKAGITPRVPLVPGFNDDDETLCGIADFLCAAGYQGPVHIMPYHGWAKSKYQALGRGANYPRIGEPSTELRERACALMRGRNLEPVLYG